jgi:hypothetical protein
MKETDVGRVSDTCSLVISLTGDLLLDVVDGFHFVVVVDVCM